MTTPHFFIFGAKIGDYFVHIGSSTVGKPSSLSAAINANPGCTLWKIQDLGCVDKNTVNNYREKYKNHFGLQSGAFAKCLVLEPHLTPINHSVSNHNKQHLAAIANRLQTRRMKATFIWRHAEGDRNGFWDFSTRRITLVDTTK